MGAPTWLRRANNPNAVTHGIITTALTTGLALIEPCKLTPAKRLAYRGAVAALTGWTAWAGMRPQHPRDLDLLGPIGRASLTVGAAGAALGVSEVGEKLDSRLHDSLRRAGVQNPRIWLAASTAVISAGLWWLGRNDRPARSNDELALQAGENTQERVALPENLRLIASRLLAATELYGAPDLRAQLEAACVLRDTDDPTDITYRELDVPDSLPRAVPGTGDFPVIGRFTALGERTFDIRLSLHRGYLAGVEVSEGADWSKAVSDEWYDSTDDLSMLQAWPEPKDIEVLIETSLGYVPAAGNR